MPDTVVVIGVFDGVHAGHRALVSQARLLAAHATLVTLSFDPHPASVLRPDTFQGLLTLPARRSELLEQAGVDRVDFLRFDDALRSLSPEEFIERCVADPYAPSAVVVGANFRFGRKAEGDEEALRVLGSKYGFDVHVVTLAGDAQAYSSTRIRHALIDGDVRHAGGMLGRPHRLSGTVVHGDKRGRTIGYPTANIGVTEPLLIPGDGVYSGRLHHAGTVHPAAVSIGTNPTFEGVVGRRVEAYVLDRDDLSLYEEFVELDLVDFVRPMLKFDSLESLLEAMALDVVTTRAQLADLG